MRGLAITVLVACLLSCLLSYVVFKVFVPGLKEDFQAYTAKPLMPEDFVPHKRY